ncbi:MAG: Uma2 family endonuclease [Chloroflexi bacterium]|nr:Uma2 family endonuclease [Chloroflexota bacterium]
MAEMTRARMTAAEFDQLPETNQPTELIEGELIVSPAPVPKHQRVNRCTSGVLEDLIPNGEIFYAPMDVYFDDDNIPQPDIIWVAEGSRCKITDKRLEGPPDLIVEIFSPGTVSRDKIDKFQLYERYGVTEYWMMDPHEAYIEVYRWQEGRYLRQGTYAPGSTFESAVLGGKTVTVAALFGGS